MGILWLNEIMKDDVALAGGKGANLGELMRNEIPVPNGFVVDSRSFIEFLEITGLKYQIIDMLRGLDVEDTQKLQGTSKMIRELIESTEMPEHIEKEIRKAYRELCKEEGEEVFVAVRSSATAEDLPEASFAGQQDTYLNVKGEDEVVEKVKKCWSSLYTPRAIYYRVQKGFRHEEVSIAVVVQKMVNSEKSGVMFTSHPVTGEKLCVIEAIFGLGEAIVSGKVSPDTYIYDRVKKRLVEVKVSEKNIMLTRNEKGETVEVKLPPEKAKQRVLTDKEIEELVKFAELIENHYNHPQDVEWAIEKGKIYIVQSRPVTTIKKEEKKEKKEKVEKEELKILLRGLGASPGIGIGKVKVIFSEKEIDKVEKGDILVTTMTTPDMVPAMKRAAAIVTDEGGLTCHAAIVSRELGVPAVVGTKEATKVLKDGMIVTVDGEKGIVYEGALEIEEKEELERRYAGKEISDLFPELIKYDVWEKVKFKRYNVKLPSYRIYPGKLHPYRQIIEEVRKKLLSLGFVEIKGPLVELNFWNCDALFMPSDHPARSIHDVFVIKTEKKGKIKNKMILERVAETHKNGWITGSCGWGFWNPKQTLNLILRSQTTAVSVRTLANKPEIPGKYFTIGRVFRPDEIDATHFIEFHQCEGIVLGENLTFRHLLGYLRIFGKEIAGAEKVRFRPSYFPFTEPSVELDCFINGKWIEVGGAGIFRPEVTQPLGINVPVLAWGIGFERLSMIKLNVNDIRKLYNDDLEWLRKKTVI